MGILQRWVRPGRGYYHEFGSDAEGSNTTDSLENMTPMPGRTNWLFPGYGVNSARSNGADLEPVPITPVRGQNWPGMQIQLSNGWQHTNYGKKISYDGYLRLLTDSSTRSRRYLTPKPSGLGPNATHSGPAPSNVQQMINQTSGAQPDSPGGPGFLSGNVDLGGRRYYG
jgi:hypothetical protein